MSDPGPRCVASTFILVLVTSIAVTGCSASNSSGPPPTIQATGTPGAEQAVGERLFLETRFAQSFKAFLDNGADINDANAGDPIVDTVETTGASLDPGPFRGLSMNCRACHLVDDVLTAPGGGMRTYADFARRSPIPARADGKTHTPRNSPPLVNSSLDRPGGILLHFDAEFNSMEDLVAATFTGRNFGWLPGERTQAIAHIARIVREDNGSNDIAQQFSGVPLRLLLSSTGDIPNEMRVPPQFRTFVCSGSDQDIFNGVVKLVAAYVNGLLFSQTDDAGNPIRSPFDVFLEKNGLPQQPDSNESSVEYSRRLRALVNAPGFTPQFVASNPNTPDGQFQFHPGQNFEFGATEFEGLKMFLTEPAALPASAGELAAGTIGNCIACHAAPNFTDFKAHNTGTTQREYDTIHGAGQ